MKSIGLHEAIEEKLGASTRPNKYTYQRGNYEVSGWITAYKICRDNGWEHTRIKARILRGEFGPHITNPLRVTIEGYGRWLCEKWRNRRGKLGIAGREWSGEELLKLLRGEKVEGRSPRAVSSMKGLLGIRRKWVCRKYTSEEDSIIAKGGIPPGRTYRAASVRRSRLRRLGRIPRHAISRDAQGKFTSAFGR